MSGPHPRPRRMPRSGCRPRACRSCAESESSRRSASLTVFWRIASASRRAEMSAAISRSARSASARRPISSRDWPIALDQAGVLDRDRGLVGEGLDERRLPRGSKAPGSGQPTWRTPSMPSSPVSGVTISDRMPSRRAASSSLGLCSNPCRSGSPCSRPSGLSRWPFRRRRTGTAGPPRRPPLRR